MIKYDKFDLYMEESVDKQLQIEFDGGTITNKEIPSEQFSLTESLSSDGLMFGSCEASEVRFRIYNVFTPLKDKWLTVTQVLDKDYDNPLQIGKYKVYSDKPTADRSYRDVVAYDSMYDIINADVASWYNSLTFPMQNISEETDIVDIPDFSGTWVEPISQRCNMEIICQNDAYYEITIDWGSSAWDNTHWEFTGEYDATQGGIVYKNGCRYEQHYPEDGSDMQQTEVYSDGEGFIYIKDEELYWEDKKEGTGEAQAFVRPDVLETSISEEFPDADYVLPDSDTVRLTEEDIADLSLQEINYAKNEIYARHGRKFQSKELRDYFNSKDWYVGTIDGADFDDGVLSQIERDNIKLLTNAEFSMDPNGYQLDQ